MRSYSQALAARSCVHPLVPWSQVQVLHVLFSKHTAWSGLQLDTRVHHLSTPSNWSIASTSGQSSFYSLISAAIQLPCPCPIPSSCMKTKTEALILGAIHRLFLLYPHYIVIISYFVFLPKKFWDVSHFSLQRLLWFCQIILSLHFLHPFKH